MADLIDRGASIRFISNIERDDEDRLFTFEEIKKMLWDATVVNNWISVEDALPEKEGNYLCTLYYAIPPYNLFHPEKDTYIREVSVKFFDGKSFIASVVAWMPMPDAYKPPEKEYDDGT